MSKVFEATLGRPFTSRNAKNDPTEMLVPSGTIPRGNERIGARKGTSEANGVITEKCARIAWHGRELKLGQRSPRCASNNRGNRRMISWVGEEPKACRCSLRYIERERERERELEQSVRRQAAKESGNLLLLFVVVAYFSPSCV